MPIQPDLSDRSRCVVTHWDLPVQCVLPPSHRDDHEAWHPESGNRIRFVVESVNPHTEELYHGKWTTLHDLKANRAAERFVAHMASRDPQELEANRAAAWDRTAGQ